MTLMRRYDGELTFEVKIDDDVEFDFDSESVDGNLRRATCSRRQSTCWRFPLRSSSMKAARFSTVLPI